MWLKLPKHNDRGRIEIVSILFSSLPGLRSLSDITKDLASWKKKAFGKLVCILQSNFET
jgi:hypothetical protein